MVLLYQVKNLSYLILVLLVILIIKIDMCISPIRIVNSSRTYTEGIDKRHFEVPCGHCHECQKRLQDDWFVRSFFEYERVRKNGSVWFFTLTYDDSHLPFFIDNDFAEEMNGEVHPFARPCFSVQDIKRFRDSLRVYLSRAGFDVSGIRFFITCELGGHYGRPHYHPLLFLPFKIPFKKLFEIINKSWKRGRCGFSKRYGMLVTSDRAIEYCCKYVSKDSAWFNFFGLNDYLWHLIKDVHNNVEGSEEKLRLFRRSYRLHFQSMKYGLSGLDKFLRQDGTITQVGLKMLSEDRIDLRDFGLDLDKDNKRSPSYGIPSYYKRRLLYYKVDYDNIYMKNDSYGVVKSLQFPSLYDKLTDKYSKYFDFAKFCEHLQPLNWTTGQLQEEFTNLQDLLSQCALNPTPYDIAWYSLSYKDIPFATDNPDDWPIPVLNKTVMELRFKMNPRDCRLYLYLMAPAFYSEGYKFSSDMPVPEGCSRSVKDRKHFEANLPGFNTLPCFYGFDDFISQVSLYESELGRVKSDTSHFEEMESFKFDLLNNVFEDKYSFVYDYMFEI